MAVPFILIDGYNLMHAVGMARRDYGPGDLERCRNAFLNFVTAHIGVRQRARTTIVFDAFEAPPDLPRRMSRRGVAVAFPESGGDADTLIEEMIAAHSAPRQLLIVSGDRRLQIAARHRRARFIDSDAFAETLQRRGPQDDSQTQTPQPVEHPKFSGDVSPSETAEWLEVFENVSETDDSSDHINDDSSSDIKIDLEDDIHSEQAWIQELQDLIDRQGFPEEPNDADR